MISIDQNCHTLWDVPAKLDALARAGRGGVHYIEDIDSAFTALGSAVDADDLRLAPERFHRSGGADWGAALFYTEFLGRVPVEVRDWEPLTGLKTNVLAKRLGRTVDDLYDAFSPSDNWQLIGSSFVGDRRHHRVIGDLGVAETAAFVRQLLDVARADLLRAFPAAASRRRVGEWLDAEQARVELLLGELAGAPLVELYRRWLGEHLPESIGLDLTSRLFSCAAPPASADERGPGTRLMDVFLTDYDRAAGLYNEAVAETGVRLRPLQVADGEMPFFATVDHRGRLVRTGIFRRGGRLRIGDREFGAPPGGGALCESFGNQGVRCIAGKAAVLVSQVRLGPGGDALAVPYRGSLYMPAAHRFARKLAAAGLLGGELKPVLRVRLRLLDRLRSLATPIRLPAHLAAAFGAEEIPARRLGEHHADVAAEAGGRLAAFRDASARERWQRESFPEIVDEIAGLDNRRREIAPRDPKAPELREIWKRSRGLAAELLDRTVRQIDRDTQVAELGYYDSRGAILPWCVALGGEAFYNEVVANAEIYEEHSLRAEADE